MKARIPQIDKAKLRKEIEIEVKKMAQMTKEQTAAEVGAEVGRMVVDLNRAYEQELDALVLWTLHEHFGFGYKRLCAFHEKLFAERKDLHDRYLPSKPDYSDNGIEADVAYQRLRQFGYDVKTHTEELSRKYPIQTFRENAPEE